MTPRHARLRLRRTGGFAGMPTEAEVDTSELEPAQADRILHALDAAPDPPPASAPQAPDTFRYELTVQRGGDTRTLTFGDPPPPELAPVVDALAGRQRIVPRDRR